MLPSKFGQDKKPELKKLECKTCSMRAPYISLFANIFLAFLKVTAGALTGSIGLVADAIHSSADVLNSFVVMLAMNISKIPHDEKHSYGYGKIENFSGLFVGTLLFIGAAIIVDSALEQLVNPASTLPPHPFGILVALISIVTNDFCYRLEYCGAKRTNSPALEADAMENYTDTLTTFAVLVGMIGAQFGFLKADPIAALVVAIIIVPVAWKLLSKNVSGLMDIGQNLNQLELINRLVSANPDVTGISYTKTRNVGSNLLIDLEILVSGKTSIAKTDEISTAIKNSLRENIEHLGEVAIVCRSEDTKDPSLIEALKKMNEERTKLKKQLEV
ncbi:MAG: cation transporter [Candidatus Riflebacteria bacterium]|nr:cation transporter [Candidatus Riflebacteria bacterium]